MTTPTVSGSTQLVDYNGEPLVKSFTNAGGPEPVTVGRVIAFAFDQPLQTDPNASYRDKWLWHKLAERAQKDDFTYNAKETDIVLERVNKIFNPSIVGQMKDLLDPEDVAAPPEPVTPSKPRSGKK